MDRTVLLRRLGSDPEGYGRRFGLSWRRSYPALVGYGLVAPLAIWVLLILVYPVLNTVYLSLTDTRIIGAPSKIIGLGNYESSVLTAAPFWRSVLLSIVWLVGNSIVQTIAAFAAALLLRQSWRFARQARIWVLLPWVIPTVAVAVIWQWMLNSNYGIISHTLRASGIIGSPLNVFGSPTGAMVGLIITNSWHWFALPAIVIFGAMQTVPVSLYDAAKVDGAGSVAQFRYITLPLIAPTLFVLELVGILWTFNVFDVIFYITRGGPADATLTAPVEIYYTAFKAWRIGEAAAMTVAVLLLLAIATVVYAKLFAPRRD